MTDWLPKLDNFRTALKQAKTAEPAQRLALLTNIAKHRLDFVAVAQLDRAVQAHLESNPTSDQASIRLALLAESTADHLAAAIRVAGLRHEIQIDVYVAPFGQITQEILGPRSGLRAFEPDIVLIAPSGRTALANPVLVQPRDEVVAAADSEVSRLSGLWTVVRRDLGAAVIQQQYLDTSDELFGSYDLQVVASPRAFVTMLNDRLATACAADEVILLDLERTVRRSGLDYWFDRTRWHQAKIEISMAASPHYGDLVVRVVSAFLGRSRKCLVLDLDNTLWGGVIGDEGLEGIRIGNGSAEGEAYLALQRHVLRLKERGIVLAVCSKNELATAQSPFLDHPDMLLGLDDIAVFIANWNDKAENLREIARRLNIGADALVFLDDNPVERERVRAALPMAAVPELPEDPAHYASRLAAGGYFEAIAFTDEDVSRASQYTANLERAQLQEAAVDLDEFLGGLVMTLEFGPILRPDLARATQLIGKTNQFKTTQRRFTADELARFMASVDAVALRFRMRDRFGDNGIVSVLLMEARGDQLEIVNWVMSCRVFGRQLEHEILNIAVEEASARGMAAIVANFEPSARNAVIAELFPSLGFDHCCTRKDGGSQWSLSVEGYSKWETHIIRDVPHAE